MGSYWVVGHERGLIEKIALKHGWSISEAKSILMRKATEYAKKFIEELAGRPYKELPRPYRLSLWITALGVVLPAFWQAAREKDDVPTYEEVKKELEKLAKKYKEISERLEYLRRLIEEMKTAAKA